MTKVPLLGDIPVLGHLFKTTSKVNNKDELLIFVTPKILREGAIAQQVVRRTGQLRMRPPSGGRMLCGPCWASATSTSIGPMGTGKTAVGKTLARLAGVPFVDSDAEIERHAGVDIPYIFEQEGEEGFRRREREALAELCTREPLVLRHWRRQHPGPGEPAVAA